MASGNVACVESLATVTSFHLVDVGVWHGSFRCILFWQLLNRSVDGCPPSRGPFNFYGEVEQTSVHSFRDQSGSQTADGERFCSSLTLAAIS